MLYSEWFANYMDFLLNQKSEEGDFDEDDAYRRLSFDTGKTILNMAVDKLVLKNPQRYQEIVLWTFDGDTTRLVFPENWARVESYMDPSIHTRFQYIPGATEVSSSVRKGADNTLVNDNGWSKGDQLKFLVVRYPDKVIGDDDTVHIPRGFIELLNLTVMNIVAYQSKQELSLSMIQAYQDQMFDWQNDIGVTRQSKTLKLKSTPLGR